MDWKERIEREGIYFGFVLGGVLLWWTIFAFLIPVKVSEYWVPLLDIGHTHHKGNLLITIVPMGLVYLIRLIAWPIKQFSKE